MTFTTDFQWPVPGLESRAIGTESKKSQHILGLYFFFFVAVHQSIYLITIQKVPTSQNFWHEIFLPLNPGTVDELQDHVPITFDRGTRGFRIDSIQQPLEKAIIFGQASLDGVFGFRDETAGNLGIHLPCDVDLIETPWSGQHLGSIVRSQSQ